MSTSSITLTNESEATPMATAACPLCHGPIGESPKRLNGTVVCAACCWNIETEALRQEVEWSTLPLAFLTGIIGALLGAIVWTSAAIYLGLGLEYLAILVGFLAGQGVLLGSNQGRGITLQLTSILTAALGIFLAKFSIMLWYLYHDLLAQGIVMTNWSLKLLLGFAARLQASLDSADLIWIAAAIGLASLLPRKTQRAVVSEVE